MGSLKSIVFAGAAIVATLPAFAADLPPIMGHRAPGPAMEDFAGGWYLRGDIGVGMTRAKQLEYLPNPANVNDFAIEHSALGDSTFIGGGIGYQFSQWLRFDGTAEYRSKSNMFAYGSYTTFCPVGICQDVYNGSVNSWVFMANAYVDLGTWWCLTPFIGAGIGVAANTFEDLSDFGPQTGGRGVAPSHTNWDLAWALHAGVTYTYSSNLKFELAYRYLNYGDASASINCIGGCAPDTYRFRDLESHDVKLGIRWYIPEPSPVLVRKG
jgi:opacity protein-like surface antigen